MLSTHNHIIMKVDHVFKALADPTRRKILELLGERELTVSEVCEHFAISQPAISRHLGVLREAGLVSAERRGQSVVYALDTTVVQDVVRVLMSLASVEGSADAGREGDGKAPGGLRR